MNANLDQSRCASRSDTRQAREGFEQIFRTATSRGGAVGNDVAYFGTTDDRERGRPMMGAALGAARDMDDFAGTEQWRHAARDLGRERASWDFAGCAHRRTRAGDHTS